MKLVQPTVKIDKTKLPDSLQHLLNDSYQSNNSSFTGLGRLFLVLGFLAVTLSFCLYLGYQSRGLRGNIQSYIESQQSAPTYR